jgi:O-antigen/teichoic acid export membrane protein
LGIYNVSNEFASIPSNEIGAPINRALLPGFAKMTEDRQAITTAFGNAIGMLALIAIPAGAGIFAVSHFLVPVVLGTKWLAGVPVMEVLGLNSAVFVFHGTIVTVLVASGRPFAATRVSILSVAVMLAGMLTLPHKFGPLGAALAVLLASVLTMPVYLLQLRKYAGVPLRKFFQVVLRPAVASFGMIAMVRLALPPYALGMSSTRAGLLLASGVGVGAFAFVFILLALWFLMGKPEGAERQVLSRVVTRLPVWIPVPGR